MSEYKLTETDIRMALRQRGHTESQIAALLGNIKADTWDEALDACMAAGWTPQPNPYRKRV